MGSAAEQEDRRSTPDKFERLATLGHLMVDWDIVRGMSLRESLRQGGRIWLQSPADLDNKARAALWKRSRPVKRFEMFLSHTWHTPGRRKLLSLLLQSGSHIMLGFWAAAVAATTVMSMLDLLPLPWTVEAHVMDFKAVCPVGPWILLASLVAFVLGLLLAPYFPNVRAKSDMCFLDMTSIHQTDHELMERGVYGIGGFLSISDDLRVLWSPPYLSRLWCVFELAAYRTANPNSKITLASLFVEALVCLRVLWEYFFALIYWSTRVLQVNYVYNFVAFLAATLPCCIALHMIRKCHMAKHKLFADLERFDLARVETSCDFDRDFIHAAIVSWYGSKEAFTHFVRGPLREELLNAMSSSALVAYPVLLLTPSMASSLTFFVCFWRGGAPAHGLASYVVGSSLGFDVLWVFNCLSLILYLCDRFAEPCRPGIFDLLQTLVVFLAFAASLFFGAAVSSLAYRSSLWASSLWLGVSLLCASLLLRFTPRCWQPQVEPEYSHCNSSSKSASRG